MGADIKAYLMHVMSVENRLSIRNVQIGNVLGSTTPQFKNMSACLKCVEREREESHIKEVDG